MDFDEYDYLEKTVEETNGAPSAKSKDTKEENESKGYRRREREDGNAEEDEKDRSSGKKSRRDDENGRERHRDRDRDKERSSRHRSKELDIERRSGDRDRDRDRDADKVTDKEREKEKRGRDRDSRDKVRDGDGDKDRDKARDGDRERDRARDKERRDKEKEKERERERREREERERSRRSRSRSRLDREREKELMMERERELELRESRRFKDKKEPEPEADPERDQRTVFAYQMPLKATERDVYEFFSKAGKVRDVRLIMDRNSRRSKGVGYIEFYDAMSVPMAIAMSGQLLLGQSVMVKPSEAEKNLVPSTATGSSVIGPYGATDRKLYVGNLHFNMTELQLKQIFEAFGAVELVQLPTDPETGHCKGFGFVQFAQLEAAKAAQSLNGKLEIAGRTIKVSSVTDHVASQESAQKTADFDDDEGGGLGLTAQSRAMLMARLDRSGTGTSATGPLGVPVVNGSGFGNQAINMPMVAPTGYPAHILTQVAQPPPEPIGKPSECLLLKNMFDPAAETEPDYDEDIRDDVFEECSKYGKVEHIYVDKSSVGYVYLRFESTEAASRAQQAMHGRWFARRAISAIFLQPYEYDAKFKGAA